MLDINGMKHGIWSHKTRAGKRASVAGSDLVKVVIFFAIVVGIIIIVMATGLLCSSFFFFLLSRLFYYCFYHYYDCYLLLSDVELNLKQGVYLFLGYSQKDEALLKKVTNQGAVDAIGAIQGLVSYHNVNSNKVRTIYVFLYFSNSMLIKALILI